jgi:hypothetical protein
VHPTLTWMQRLRPQRHEGLADRLTPPARLVANGGQDQEMWRSSTLLLARSFCSARSRPRRRPQGRRERNRPPTLFNAALPLLLSNSRQRSPKKDSTAITTTITPMIQKILFILVSHPLRSGPAWPTHRRSPSGLTPRRIIGQVGTQRAHRAGHYSPRPSPGALTQISSPEIHDRRRTGGGNHLDRRSAKSTKRNSLKALIQISGARSSEA